MTPADFVFIYLPNILQQFMDTVSRFVDYFVQPTYRIWEGIVAADILPDVVVDAFNGLVGRSDFLQSVLNTPLATIMLGYWLLAIILATIARWAVDILL